MDDPTTEFVMHCAACNHVISIMKHLNALSHIDILIFHTLSKDSFIFCRFEI